MVFFWGLKEIEGKADAAALCEKLRPVLADIGPLHVKSVVLDGASVNKRAMADLTQIHGFQHITFVQCHVRSQQTSPSPTF